MGKWSIDFSGSGARVTYGSHTCGVVHLREVPAANGQMVVDWVLHRAKPGDAVAVDGRVEMTVMKGARA